MNPPAPIKNIHFNPDGFRKKKSVQGFQNYLRWKSQNEKPFLHEELNKTTERWCNDHHIYVRSTKEKFKKSIYWYLGFIDPDLRTEWEILGDDALWKEIKRRKILHHPDHNPKDENIFKLLTQIERILQKRKEGLAIYHKAAKPEWL